MKQLRVNAPRLTGVNELVALVYIRPPRYYEALRIYASGWSDWLINWQK